MNNDSIPRTENLGKVMEEEMKEDTSKSPPEMPIMPSYLKSGVSFSYPGRPITDPIRSACYSVSLAATTNQAGLNNIERRAFEVAFKNAVGGVAGDIGVRYARIPEVGRGSGAVEGDLYSVKVWYQGPSDVQPARVTVLKALIGNLLKDMSGSASAPAWVATLADASADLCSHIPNKQVITQKFPGLGGKLGCGATANVMQKISAKVIKNLFSSDVITSSSCMCSNPRILNVQ